MKSAEQSEANFAPSRRGTTIRPALAIGAILLALALAVIMLRLHRLSELPPGLHNDEGAHGVNALQVLQGEHAAFFPDNNGREGLIAYAIALAVSFLGRTALAIRVPTALASAATVFAVFWLGWRLFGWDEDSGRATPWRGLLIGGIGAGLLAVSVGQTVLGRTAFRGNFLPLLLSLCFALLWLGWRHRSLWQVALAGVCAGLLPYTYIPARFTPLLFVFFGLSFLPSWISSQNSADIGETGPLTRFKILWRSDPLGRNLPLTGLFVGVAMLVAAPILIHFALHTDHFFLRSEQTLVFDPERNQGNPLGTFLNNVWGYLLAFGFRGDPLWRHNFSGRPMLNPLEAIFFWVGAGMAVWRWQRRPAYRLLLLWLGVLFLPAMLARESASVPPNTLRIIGAAPAVYLLVAVGVWESSQYLKARYVRQKETKAALALAVVVPVLILAQGVLTYRTYFQKWAAAPEIQRAYEAEWPELIQMVYAHPPDGSVVYLIPGYLRQYSFEFLYQGKVPVHFLHSATPNFAHKIESTLAATESLSTIKVVDWDIDVIWKGNETELLAVLLSKYGRYLGSDEYDILQVHNYAELSFDRPWTFYDYMEPRTVNYDGGISLQGLALGRGEEQLSSRQPLILEEERAFWLVLKWETAPDLHIDYAISLRLHDAEGRAVYHKDEVLWKADHTKTGNGGPSELFDTPFQVDIPSDLLPGEYELRLIVYDEESLKPTVELGVWEPEVALARLRLEELQK